MSADEQLHQNHPNQSLDFIVPFDGTQPEIEIAEREAVSERFRSLIDDTLLNNAGHVGHDDHLPGYEEDTILLYKKTDKSEEWKLYVRNPTSKNTQGDEWEAAEILRGTIDIESAGQPGHSYRLGGDGVVRRVDLSPPTFSNKQKASIGGAALKDLEVAAVAEEKEMMEVDLPNSRLERQMGQNDQPIGLAEMQGLEDYARQPGFEPWLGH